MSNLLTVLITTASILAGLASVYGLYCLTLWVLVHIMGPGE